ncbi:hypothetical protein EDD15DRAFT_2204760 [Pisolithus albus]|nr:hypothetical protein EDD15DRAFT_2204760 [Pisolithus albus]
MSSAVYPIPGGPRNMLQMTHNILATENVTLTQLWATTLVPTTPPVSASVMLVAPQHCGHFPWFLIKSPIINFVRSLQPTPVEHDLRMFALTWADRANAVQFSVEGKTFLLFFCDSAMFWCFKYMVHCRDQVDRHRHHVPELNAKALLDAFLDFKIPMEVPLGIRMPKSANSMQTPPVRYALDYNHRQVNTVVSTMMLREGGMGERTPGPTVSDMRPAAHTSRSHSIVMGDDAGGTSGSVQPALLDPINSGEGGTADCDLTVRRKKRKLM